MARGKTVEQIAKANIKRDTKEIVQLIMDSPIREIDEDNPLLDFDKEHSFDYMKTANTDVRTRMWLRVAGEAMNGNLKAAELMLKASGEEPAKETNINVNLPTFVDDLGDLDDDLNVVIKPKRKKKVKPEDPPTFVKE